MSGRRPPLDVPRPPSPDERALLDALVALSAVADLVEQVARAEVVSACSCGCPSVGLHTDAPDLPPDVARRLVEPGLHDVVMLTAYGTNAAGDGVQVTLHVIAGTVEELEIWPGVRDGKTATDLPSPAALRRGS